MEAETIDLEEFLQRLQPSLHFRILDPIWFFREDVERFYQLLEGARAPGQEEPPARVEILSERGPLDGWEAVLEQGPHGGLAFLLPEEHFLVLLFPHEAVVCSRYEWTPERWEADLTERVVRFLQRRRHFVWFLGKRGWQLVGMFLAWLLVVPAALTSISPPGLHRDLLWVMSIPGEMIGLVVMALAVLGLLIPNPRRLTIWNVSREVFGRRIREAGIFIFLGTLAIALGALLSRIGGLGIKGLLFLPLLGGLIALALWFAADWITNLGEE